MKAKYILPVSLLVIGAVTYGQADLKEALQVRFAQHQEMPSAEQQQRGALQHIKAGKVEFQTPQTVCNQHRIDARGNVADSLVLYGLKGLDQGGDLAGAPYNVIRFNNVAGTAKYDVSPEIGSVKAAFYAQGRFYTLKDGENVTLTTYDATTWENLGQKDLFPTTDYLRQVATVDPTTGKAYFLLWGTIDWNTYRTPRPLYCLDLESQEAVQVGTIDNLFIQTMFFDNEGQLYGIPYNENALYKINKENGEYEKVGDLNLGFNRYPFCESAVVDPATGIVYWVVVDRSDSQSYIYIIDYKNAQVELVGDMPNDEHLLGLYIPSVAAAAPAAVSGIDYKNGKLCFNVPTKTYTTGADLTGELTAVVVADGETITKAVTAGEEVEMAIELGDGMHSLSICVKNEAGEGAARIYDFFAGVDTPLAVTDVVAEIKNVEGEVAIRWQAPAGSVNGGAFDDSEVRYDIVRVPDNKVVATNLAETTVSDQLPEKHEHYSYVVVAKVAENVSEETTSNEVIFGNIWIPNYTEYFSAPEDWALFTVVDKNQDGSTFQYVETRGFGILHGNGAYDPETNPGGGKGMDDYLITPAIRLEKNTEYRFRFDVSELGNNQHLGVMLGTSTDVASLSTLKDFDLRWADDNTGLTVYFNVPEDGLYHLALQDISPVFSASFWFDNFSIDLYSRFEGPAAVENLKATAGAQGAIANTISCTAPTKTFKGEAQTEKMDLYIERDGKQICKMSGVEPGQEVSFDDKTVTGGEHTYRVYCVNAAGEGQEALVTNWVGLDVPVRPVVLSAHQNGSYQPVVTWEAVATGEHGGYVDPSGVTYLLCKYNAWDYSNQWPVVATTTNLTAVDETYMSYYGQDNVTYAVFAENEAGIGNGSSFGITLGQPWETPYSESFSYGFAWNSPWVLHANTYYYAWQITTGSGLAVKPYDETGSDGGMLYYTWMDDDSNNEFMEGPRVALSGLNKGELSFYMYHGFEADEEDVVLEVYANYNDQGWKKIGEVDYNNGTTGWSRSSFKLDKVEAPEGFGPSCVQIGFAGVTTVPSASIFIDLIKIEDGIDTDLAMVSVLGDKRIKAGDKQELTFAVANYGMEAIQNYSIDYEVLNAADSSTVIVGEISGDNVINPGEVKTLSTSIELDLTAAGQSYIVVAEAVVENDGLTDNNTASFNFMVRGSNLPAATELTAVAGNEGVNLSWTAPEKSEITDPVTDGFDDYESFIIDEIGDWKVYDGDGATPVHFGGPSIPHDFDAKAWQVWAPEEAGFSIERFPVLTPHSGTKVLTSWTASDGVSTTLPTDDWLISSEIEGGSDLSFYYRVPNAGSDPQNVEILYSTTDQLPENFEHVDGDAVSGTTEWVKLEYSLPKDARYFAIRNWNNGGSTTVAFIDDVEYTPLYGSTTPLTFVGYRIYRDGKMIADGVQETSYIDEVEPGDYTYFVTTVWAEGESNTTNEATVEVITEIGSIEVSEGIELFRVDGTRVEGQATEAGVYLMRQGDKISKVVVR